VNQETIACVSVRALASARRLCESAPKSRLDGVSVDVDSSGLIAEVRVIVSSHKLADLAACDGGRLMDLQAVATPALD
jgi:hypothetical protein